MIAKSIFLPLVALLFFLAGCIKQETIVTAFSFSSNGVKLSGHVYTSTYKRDSTSGNEVLITKLYIDNKDYVQIHYSAPNYIATGTYSNSDVLSYTSDSTVYTLTSGNLTITQIDTIAHKISGTFQFSGINPSASPTSVTFNDEVLTTWYTKYSSLIGFRLLVLTTKFSNN